MNRKERRAAAHKERKLARKAGFPTLPPPPPTPPPTPAAPAPVKPVSPAIPEPGIPFPSLSSISPAKLAANRANAQLSTGPSSAAGRAASSQNHTSHGLARHNGSFLLLTTEDPSGFEALKASLAAEHQPATETESILVTTMSESYWLANRAQNLQNSCLDPNTGQITDAKMFPLYLRYQTTHTRAFHKSLNDLLKLRAEKRKIENGFEAQARKEEELRIKNEQHEMKKQSHYWEVLKKDAEACFRISQNLAQNYKAAAENPGFEAQYAAELAKHGLQPDYCRGAASAAA
jgi:hypothetical protein